MWSGPEAHAIVASTRRCWFQPAVARAPRRFSIIGGFDGRVDVAMDRDLTLRSRRLKALR